MGNLETYVYTLKDLEHIADHTKAVIIDGLVNEGILEKKSANEWCETHTVIIHNKPLFKTILEKIIKIKQALEISKFDFIGCEKNMRDPKRIPIILERLKIIWEKFPDLRLGQLILNAEKSDLVFSSVYNTEDNELLNEIEKRYNKLESKNMENLSSTEEEFDLISKILDENHDMLVALS